MSKREYGFWLMLFGGILVLLVRLVWLTLVKGEEFKARADGNRVEIRQLQAPRGVIVDRNGEKLAINVPGKDRDQVERKYIYGSILSHVLGYGGESDQVIGRIEGKMGVEKWLDEKLRGEDGAEIVETGASGEVLRSLGRREPVAGEEVKLTIDLGLQRKVVEAVGDRKGGVVVTTSGGEILALVSSPSFDPEKVVEAVADEDKPLFNRVVGGAYPPGSVFKLVTAVAGLEEGKITDATEIEDTGEIRIGQFRYGNWYFDQYGRKEGLLNIVGALKRSNDIFFYQVGQLVGVERLADWARRFGLGQKLNLGWGVETAGLVPDQTWKEKIKGERWFLGNTYHMAMGQGDITTTPLQINLMTQAVATGRLCRPRLVLGEEEKCEDLKISQQTLDLVRQGMEAACSQGGTGFPFFDFEPKVACQTGTAQPGGAKNPPLASV